MRPICFLFFVFFIVSSRIQASDPQLTILMYHGISDGCAADIYEKRRESFIKDMEYIQEHFDVISMQDVKEVVETRKTLLRNTIVLTFDDGTASNYYIAAPILEEFGFPATFFVITDRCGEEGFMTWEQIVDLSKRKSKNNEYLFSIGSHSCSHRYPGLEGLSQSQLKHELEDSKKAIEQHTGKQCIAIALPYGKRRGDPDVIDLAVELGYEMIRTSRTANVKTNGTNLFDLPSLPLYDFTPPEYIGACNQSPMDITFFDPVKDVHSGLNPVNNSHIFEIPVTGIESYTASGNKFVGVEAVSENSEAVESIKVTYIPPQNQANIRIVTKPGRYENIKIDIKLKEPESHDACGYFNIYFKMPSEVTSVKDQIENQIFIYPNPVKDWMEIRNVGENPVYRIYNSQGQYILSGQGNKLNLGALANGMYIITIHQDRKLIKLKFVKE